ncbi:MAG: hypothetical protein U1D30_09520 [Planctomycetota bacterium]
MGLDTGCTYQPPGPPWDYPTTTVSGRITYAMKPIPDGWVTLEPFAETVGDQVIGRIDKEGYFQIEGAPIGPLQIRIRFSRELADALAGNDPRRQRALLNLASPGSPLQIRTQPGKPESFDFDLVRILGPSGRP